MASTGLDVAGLYAALETKRRSVDKSWRQVAKEAGVSPSTITRMKEGKRPDVDGFAALMQWLGTSADAFITRPDTKHKSAQPPAAQIMTFLRARKELDADSVAAIEDLIQAACKLLKRSKT